MFLLAVAAIAPLAANAQNKTYTVRQGDTISEIASRLHVSQRELIAANALPNSNRLQPGVVLRIPARLPEATPLAAPKGAAYYTVRNGDFDWSLARRNGISVTQLKALNPGINFATLQVGTRIAIPAAGSAKVASIHVGEKVAAKSAAKSAYRSHKVAKGEFDWIIAKHGGVSLAALKAANPGVDLDKLQIGQVIRVPGGSISASNAPTRVATAAAPKIRTSYAIVSGDGSTIRRTPSTNSGKVAAVDSGTRVKVLDRDGDWYKLKFPKGTVGWMRGDLLKPVSSSVIAKERSATRVASNSAPKRSIIKSDSRPSRVARGSRPSLTPTASTNSAVRVALSQIGKRYVWASTSPSRGGFDCSGLVTYAYNKVGVKLPRTSRDMSGYGQKVTKDSMKPGDLVFFHTGRSSRVNHVAMYIGNGKIVHSSSGQGGVRVDSITTGYYARKMVGVRRVAKSPSKPSKPSAPKPQAE